MIKKGGRGKRREECSRGDEEIARGDNHLQSQLTGQQRAIVVVVGNIGTNSKGEAVR